MANADVFEDLGELALGSRLKRLSDEIMREGAAVYEHYRIEFEPRWFPVFYTLARNGKQTVTELSAELNMSHPAVIKQLKGLEKRGLVRSQRDRSDARKRQLSLTSQAEELLPQLEVAWKDIADTIHNLLQHQHDNLLNAIREMEDSFREQPFSQRVLQTRTDRSLAEVEIIDYKKKWAEHFKQLNYDWIDKYFTIEEVDRKVLEGHQKHILNKGGYICFARIEGQIVGTCALIRFSDEEFELSKMAVDEDWQGRQIGKKLGLHVIEKARELGCKRLFLDSNRTLTPALNLYRKLGFRQIHFSGEQSVYERSDVRMEMYL